MANISFIFFPEVLYVYASIFKDPDPASSLALSSVRVGLARPSAIVRDAPSALLVTFVVRYSVLDPTISLKAPRLNTWLDMTAVPGWFGVFSIAERVTIPGRFSGPPARVALPLSASLYSAIRANGFLDDKTSTLFGLTIPYLGLRPTLVLESCPFSGLSWVCMMAFRVCLATGSALLPGMSSGRLVSLPSAPPGIEESPLSSAVPSEELGGPPDSSEESASVSAPLPSATSPVPTGSSSCGMFTGSSHGMPGGRNGIIMGAIQKSNAFQTKSPADP